MDGRNQGHPIHPLISPSFLQKLPEVRLPAVPSQVRCPCHTWAWFPRIERPLEAAHRLNQPSLSLLRLRLTRRAAHHYLLCVLFAASFPSVREKLPRARLFPVRRRIPSPVSRLVDVPAQPSSAKIPASFLARVKRTIRVLSLLRILSKLRVARLAPMRWSLPFHLYQLRMRK
jgi:hypothetical protein